MAIQKSASLLPWARRVPYDEAPASACEKWLQFAIMPETMFVRMLRLERRRTERSGKQFMLVLISSEDFRVSSGSTLLCNVVESVSRSTRETDILGWYEADSTLGLLMTEIGQADAATIDTIVQKISVAIQTAVTPEDFRRLTLLFHIFPQKVDDPSNRGESLVHYPDLSRRHQPQLSYKCALKRGLDIVGSVAALIAFLPAFIVIALFIKLTSEGSVLFCQKRIGQYGKEFTLYKFRTMYTNNNSQIHEEYVAKLIGGGLGQQTRVYKLVNDPRVTRCGRFLRKTSLDELPQFVNVLMGDMSLVGPRPPLQYEYGRYQTWHRRRVLELKPGLTGLWQVKGRSRTTFDEMVRMDLKYAKTMSLWLDIKLLLQTPGAVFSCRGAS